MVCPVCNESKNFMLLMPELSVVNNVLCSNCGLVFIPERSETIMDYYADDGYFKKSPNLALREGFISKSLLIALANERIDLIETLFDMKFDNKNVLDIGCGYGELLFVLKERSNAKVQGIEPSPAAANKGVAYFDLPIQQCVLENFKSDSVFNFIITCHTLEHTVNPRAFLSKIHSLLSTDGFLYVEVPNVMHPTGNFPLSTFFYNEHLQTFSIHNLTKLLIDTGFSISAYNDDNFLRVLCYKGTKNQELVNPPKLSSSTILDSLRQYKANYTAFTLLKVYYQKFRYLLRIIYHATFKPNK